MRELAKHVAQLIGTLGIILAGPVSGQVDDFCTCEFIDPEYTATGIRAACAAYMGPGKTSCTIDFSGISANRTLVQEITGMDETQYNEVLFEVLFTYSEAFAENTFTEIRQPEFIQIAVPVLARGIYLRDQSQIGLDVAADLDEAIRSLVLDYADKITSVFTGIDEPFFLTINNFLFRIYGGYINVYGTQLGDDFVMSLVVAPPP